VLGWGVVFGYLTARLKMDDQSPTSTGKGPDVIEQALDEALAKGKIAYDIPAEMKEGKAKKAEVRIAKGIDQDVVAALKQHLRDRAQVDDIQVAPFMTVRLNAEKDSFDIQALTQDNQAVTDKTYTTWAWLLTPQQSGEKTLYLSVGTRFKLPGRDEETEFRPLYEREVKVQVDRIYEAKRFASSNWQWLGGAIVIPLIGFFWRLRKKKPPSAKPPEQRSLIIQP